MTEGILISIWGLVIYFIGLSIGGCFYKERRKDTNNITKWLNSIDKDFFANFVYIRDIVECNQCPAKQFCDKNASNDRCEEIFYQWAIKEGDKQ